MLGLGLRLVHRIWESDILMSMQPTSRPAIASDLERKAQRQLRKGIAILKVAKLVGLGTGTVHRIKREMDAG
jgi:hypothetical protein